MYILTILLILNWLALSGVMEPFYLITGLVSVAASLVISRYMDVVHKDYKLYFLKTSYLKYFIKLSRNIILTSLKVSKFVWSFRPARSSFVAIDLPDERDKVALLANSITLTPGTISVNIEDDKLLIHVLDEEEAEEVSNIKMDEL